MTRHVKLPAPESTTKWAELSELEILVETRKTMLSMIGSIDEAAKRGDVYPQMARELHGLTGKVAQYSREIRQLKKDAQAAAENAPVEKRRKAVVQLFRQLPLEDRRNLFPILKGIAEEGGLS